MQLSIVKRHVIGDNAYIKNHYPNPLKKSKILEDLIIHPFDQFPFVKTHCRFNKLLEIIFVYSILK